MQGLGILVSAASQGGKAGPQASSSCNRSSTLVGDLANVEYNTTRRSNQTIHLTTVIAIVMCFVTFAVNTKLAHCVNK